MLKFDHVLDTQALLNAPGITPSAPSRRAAIKLSLGAGYAAATLPIMAQTAVKTPADGLTAGEVTIDVNGFKMGAYRAAPACRGHGQTSASWSPMRANSITGGSRESLPICNANFFDSLL